MLAELAFWTACFALGWVYLGYPLAVGVLGSLRPIRLRETGAAPTVTVALAVHDEAAQIRDRLANLLAQDPSGDRLVEVLVGSDGSTDATNALVAAQALDDPRVRLLSLPRTGTTPTQQAMFEAATGDVVLLTDAETRFLPGCIAALAEVFRDERVGCATGRLQWFSEDATATSRNEGLYWRYERRIRALESRAGCLTAGTGAILAVRRSSFRPVTATTGMDHLLPLFVLEQGQLVVFVPNAVASDRPISGLREQFRNRTRTATRGIAANLSMVRRLSPWRHPQAALGLWSHKILRWGTPWFAAVAVASAVVLALNGRVEFWIVPGAAVVAGAAALIAHAISRTGRKPPRIIAFARAIAVVNAAFAVAWVNVLLGRRIEAWHRADWQASR